jgi:hypothetical protein
VIDSFEIVGDFLTEEAAREGMVAIAAELNSTAAFAIHRHDDAARVGAVVGTDRPDGG